MGDADAQIIRLLTELRDAQREELAYRRAVLSESLDLTRRAVRMQRVGLQMVGGMALLGLAVAGLVAIGAGAMRRL